MGNYDWIAPLISAGAGLWEANDKRKNTMNPKDMWNLGNPSVSTPFYNTSSSWNDGKPTEDRQFTPELQQIFDNLIFGALNTPRDQRGMSDNMGRLQNAQENYQLSRFGQEGDPYVKKSPLDNDINIPDSIGAGIDDPDYGDQTGTDPSLLNDPLGVGDFDPSMTDQEQSYNNLNPNNNPRTGLDEIQRAIAFRERNKEYNDWNNDWRSGGSMGSDGNWNVGDIANQFLDREDGNNMYNDVIEYDKGGAGKSWAGDNAESLGRAFSAATGLPFLGVVGSKFQDWLYQNRTFMNPLNSNDPYGLGSTGGSSNNPTSYYQEGDAGMGNSTLDQLLNPYAEEDAELGRSEAGNGNYDNTV